MFDEVNTREKRQVFCNHFKSDCISCVIFKNHKVNCFGKNQNQLEQDYQNDHSGELNLIGSVK